MRRKCFELIQYMIETPDILVVSSQTVPSTKLYRAAELQEFNPATYAPSYKSETVPCPQYPSAHIEPIFYGIVPDNEPQVVGAYEGYPDIKYGDRTPYAIVSCRKGNEYYIDKNDNDSIKLVFYLNMANSLNMSSRSVNHLNGDLLKK